jgi:hypothetical protein
MYLSFGVAARRRRRAASDWAAADENLLFSTENRTLRLSTAEDNFVADGFD